MTCLFIKTVQIYSIFLKVQPSQDSVTASKV